MVLLEVDHRPFIKRDTELKKRSDVPTREQAAAYAEMHLMPTVQSGLQALCRERPTEPIEWLAAWLIANKPTPPVVNVAEREPKRRFLPRALRPLTDTIACK